MKIFILVGVLFFLLIGIQANNLEGIVKDGQTGEVLIGANVYLKSNRLIGTTTGFDGTFKLSDVKSGKVTLVCSYISYQTLEKQVEITSETYQRITIGMLPSETQLNDVVVVAGAKISDLAVRNMERLSSNVMNIVGAKSIEISPDLSVANILQRVSGVVMERNSSGEGQYAILRGMDKRYNTTLVNGVKISSPDNKQRYIPLDIFPGELLDRLEVSKTQTAEKEGDATGGSINMVMKDAPSRFELKMNVATGYNGMFADKQFIGYDYENLIRHSPYESYGKDHSADISNFGNKIKALEFFKPQPNVIAGISLGNRFIDNKLGCMVAANYQHMYKGSEGIFYGDYMNQNASTVIVDKYEERNYYEEQIQFGLHAKFDYKFNVNHKLSFYNAYIDARNPVVRQITGTNLSLNYNPPQNMSIAYRTRLRLTDQQIFASTLQGEHTLNKRLQLDWSAVYSSATLQRPAQAYVEMDNTRVNGTDDIFVDVDGNIHRWEHNRDVDFSGIVHAKYNMNLAVGKLTLQTGGLYRSKNRDNFWIEYTLKPENLSQKMGVDFESIDDIHQINWYVGNPKGSLGPLDYEARESIGAAYLQGKLERSGLELIAGLRYEYTDQGYFLLIKSLVYDQVGGQKYHDFLPNIHLKYSPESNTNWRMSYYRSINRPGFFEIVPYMVVNEDYTEYGNPDLKRAAIDNFDLRWELFPKPTEQIMIGAFYKHIDSPIEFAYFSKNDRQYGYGPRNLGNANNLGIEIDFIKFVREFGIKANYTYTYSAIKTPKVYYTVNDRGYTEKLFQDQVRPLVGQAGHVANFSFLYKNTKHSVDGQLAVAYTGEKIVIASHFLNSDYWQKPSLQLDASAEKRFRNGLSVFVKANNLLNSPSIEFIKTHNDANDSFPYQSAESGETIIRRSLYNRSILAGIRFKL
jgi:outer membrane receptor protein involved in Fe transport